jgi:hypothetical protein
VQVRNEAMFRTLGWTRVRPVTVAGAPHTLMRWPTGRIQAQARTTKAALGPLLAGLSTGGPGFVGDDGAPVPGSALVAACDAILPSMVERDPEWAGWCSVLVNVDDLAAMGAQPPAHTSHPRDTHRPQRPDKAKGPNRVPAAQAPYDLARPKGLEPLTF